MIVTDMSERERLAFAKKAETLGASATRLAEALRTGNDGEALLHLVLTVIKGGFINDLTDVFGKAVATDVPDGPGFLAGPVAPVSNSNGEDQKK